MKFWITRSHLTSLLKPLYWGRIVFAILLGATMLTAACDTSGPAVGGTEDTVLHRGNGAEPDSLDPHRSTGTWESNILRDLIMGLYTEDVYGNAIPGSAVSHTVSDDGLVYTFALREGMVWSDGVPVTADDFVFALQRILDPKTAAQYASLIYVIKNAYGVNTGELPLEAVGARAIDDHRLEIILENPAPFFIELTTHQTMYPVPKHVIEKLGDAWVRAENMVGNGPYKLAEWVPQGHIRTVKNELFFDAANVQIDEVFFYPTVDATAALKQFRAGELDINSGLPLQQIDWLRENLPEETKLYPYMGVSYIAFNTERAPFDDARVRMALSMAINRPILTDNILKAGQVPALSFVPPGISNHAFGAMVDFSDLSMDERIEKAKELLAEAGFDESNPLTFEYKFREGVDGKRLAVAVRSMWQQIGVNAQLLHLETKTHYNDLRTGDFLVGDAGWIADYNDAQNFLYLLQTSSGTMNYGRYSSDAFDALTDQAATTLDLVARAGLMKQAEQIMLDDQPLIPTYFAVSSNLVHTHVKGWEPNVTNRHATRYMYFDKTS